MISLVPVREVGYSNCDISYMGILNIPPQSCTEKCSSTSALQVVLIIKKYWKKAFS